MYRYRPQKGRNGCGQHGREILEDPKRRDAMKPKLRVLNPWSTMVVLGLLSFLVGCASMERAPNGKWMYYHKELVAADRAVEAARAAGKNRECPDEFNAAEKMKNDAYATYEACRTKEGIAMANRATDMANALCPRRVVAPPPPAPAVSLSASPAAIDQSQCTTLTWSSANASSAAIDQGIGSVDLNGSRQICPPNTTQYTITAQGIGGSQTAATTVVVNPPPPAAVAPPPPPPVPAPIVAPPPAAAAVAPAPKVIDRLTIHVNFDFDKSVVRKEDHAELQNAVDFVKKYPQHQVSIEGHTDSIGTDKYNQALSERRAAAVKEYLVKAGVANDQQVKTVGYGESKPIADNKTDRGRFENRRVEILILSE
jgi:OOP family OmpA-OmpF porin